MWNDFFEIEKEEEEKLVEEFHEKNMSRKKRRERKNKEKMKKHSIVKKNTRGGIGLRERPEWYFVSRNSKKVSKTLAHRKERRDLECEVLYKTISCSKPGFPFKNDNTVRKTPLIRVVLQI